MTTVLTQLVARLLLPITLMVALATLVKGYSDVGDGFSAGVIASLGVTLQFLAFGYRAAERRLPVRYAPLAAFGGLGLALLVAFAPLLAGDPLLTHYPRPGTEPAHLGRLELMTPVLFDAGVFLLVLGFTVSVLDLVAEASDSKDLP